MRKQGLGIIMVNGSIEAERGGGRPRLNFTRSLRHMNEIAIIQKYGRHERLENHDHQHPNWILHPDKKINSLVVKTLANGVMVKHSFTEHSNGSRPTKSDNNNKAERMRYKWKR